jgi:hypothetical protein
VPDQASDKRLEMAYDAAQKKLAMQDTTLGNVRTRANNLPRRKGSMRRTVGSYMCPMLIRRNGRCSQLKEVGRDRPLG